MGKDLRGDTRARHRKVLPVYARFERTIDGVEKVVAVVLNVKRQQIVAEQSVEQLILPWANAENLAIRPGDVPELGHNQVGSGALQHPREERKVVVLYEDYGGITADFVEDGIGEFLVDAAIMVPVRRLEFGTGVGDVAQGPEGFIGEAAVVPVQLLLREPDPAQSIRRVVRGDGDAIVLVNDVTVGFAAPVRDPHAAAGAHDRVERRGQSTGGLLAADFTIAKNVAEGLAIGNDHQLRPLQGLGGDDLKSVTRPGHADLLVLYPAEITAPRHSRTRERSRVWYTLGSECARIRPRQQQA